MASSSAALLKLQALTREDLLEVANDDGDASFDEAFLDEFETAWTQFLREKKNPTIGAAPCQREQRIAALQKRGSQLQQSKDAMEREFQKQIAFFQEKAIESEQLYATEIEEAVQQQLELREKWTAKLQANAAIETLQEQTLPWFHFVNELDRLAAAATANNNLPGSHQQQPSDEINGHKVARPSARAMLLCQQQGNSPPPPPPPLDHANNGTHQQQQEQLLRANRIDHALMTTHVSMLHKEVERYEHLLNINKDVGGLLTELNVWSILQQQRDP